MALVIINSYDVKDYIEINLSEPATGFIRYENVEKLVGDTEINNCNIMFANNKKNVEYNDNILFALKLNATEMNSCKLKKYPLGFQLITKVGLDNINSSKWHRNCCGNNGNLLNRIINDNLTKEINKTKIDTLNYLNEYCAQSLLSPIHGKYGYYNYDLILQRKNLTNIAVDKLKGIINLADIIHRKTYEMEIMEKMENVEDWN